MFGRINADSITTVMLLGGKNTISRSDFSYWYLYTRGSNRRVELEQDVVIKHLYTGATLITYQTGKLSWDIQQGALLDNFVLVISEMPIPEEYIFIPYPKNFIDKATTYPFSKVSLEGFGILTSIPATPRLLMTAEPAPGMPVMDVAVISLVMPMMELMNKLGIKLPTNFHPIVDTRAGGGIVMRSTYTDWEAFELDDTEFVDSIFTTREDLTINLKPNWLGKANYYYRILGNNHHGILISGQQIDLNRNELGPDIDDAGSLGTLMRSKSAEMMVSIRYDEAMETIEVVNPGNLPIQIIVLPRKVNVSYLYKHASMQITPERRFRLFLACNDFVDGKSKKIIGICSANDDAVRKACKVSNDPSISPISSLPYIGYVTDFVASTDGVIHFRIHWEDKVFERFHGLMALHHSVYPVFSKPNGDGPIVGFNYQQTNPLIETRKLIEKFEFKFGV